MSSTPWGSLQTRLSSQRKSTHGQQHRYLDPVGRDRVKARGKGAQAGLGRGICGRSCIATGRMDKTDARAIQNP